MSGRANVQGEMPDTYKNKYSMLFINGNHWDRTIIIIIIIIIIILPQVVKIPGVNNKKN